MWEAGRGCLEGPWGGGPCVPSLAGGVGKGAEPGGRLGEGGFGSPQAGGCPCAGTGRGASAGGRALPWKRRQPICGLGQRAWCLWTRGVPAQGPDQAGGARARVCCGVRGVRGAVPLSSRVTLGRESSLVSPPPRVPPCAAGVRNGRNLPAAARGAWARPAPATWPAGPEEGGSGRWRPRCGHQGASALWGQGAASRWPGRCRGGWCHHTEVAAVSTGEGAAAGPLAGAGGGPPQASWQGLGHGASSWSPCSPDLDPGGEWRGRV